MDAFVTVKFKFNNVCNEEDLKEISFEDMVSSLIEDEGLMGVVDLEDYKILSIERKK